MIRLYIADTDSTHISSVRRALSRNRSIEIVGSAKNGRQALRELIALKPDALLTDIQLPELDGIALLRETRRMRRPPSVIICTRFYSGASMEWAFRHDASYFLCKPIDYDGLPELIVDCARIRAVREETADSSDDPPGDAATHLLLNQLGISPRLSGGAYLVESVNSLRRNELLLRNLSRGLYAEIAGRLNTTVPRVERSLRSAIASGYERGAMKDVFAHRPTNREFIEYLMKAVEALPDGRTRETIDR